MDKETTTSVIIDRKTFDEGFTAYQVLTNSECASVLPQE